MNREPFEKTFRRLTLPVEPKIRQLLRLSMDKQFHKQAEYQFLSGGKRLRPVLTIAACLACGGRRQDALYPAAGLEILHNCTLIFDDMIDNSPVRRGKPALWQICGAPVAQCIAMGYIASVFQAANRSKHPDKISEIFARAIKTAAAGQIRDILFEPYPKTVEDQTAGNSPDAPCPKNYLQMAGQKTGAIFQACCEAGAVSASAENDAVTALKNFGLNLGIAFQIRDDLADIFGDEQHCGRKKGADIQEKKTGNILIMYTLQELRRTGMEDPFLKILKKTRVSSKDIQNALDIIRRTDAREKTLLLKKNYLTKATANLDRLPGNRWNRFLNEISDTMAE